MDYFICEKIHGLFSSLLVKREIKSFDVRWSPDYQLTFRIEGLKGTILEVGVNELQNKSNLNNSSSNI